MEHIFTLLSIDNFGLNFLQLGLIFILPFLLILGIFEIYSLMKSKSNKKYIRIK
jgi:hypothetical protein